MVPTYNLQVSKWRLQCREAEARLAEVMGTKPGDSKTLVWGIGDEERFRGELDETVRDSGQKRVASRFMSRPYYRERGSASDHVGMVRIDALL